MSENLEKLITDVAAMMRAAHELGTLQERERIATLLRGEASVPAPAAAEVASTGGIRAGAYRAGQRVAAGTIRPLVMEALRAMPGATKAEISHRVTSLNPNVAPTSISNELQRNCGKDGQRLYRRKGDRWYLQDANELPETEGPAVTVGDRPAGVTRMNGGDYDETTTALNPSGSA